MLRPLQKSDLPAVMAIENAVHIAPWTEDAFKTCFQSGYTGWVMEAEQQILGFIIVSMTEVECHILNLCVMQSHQRQGLGRQLLQYALTEAKQRKIGIAYLEVRRSNAGAIALYQTLGFRLVGERKRYYPGVPENEDALVFARSLSSC